MRNPKRRAVRIGAAISFLAFVALTSCGPDIQADVKAIVGATLIDGTGGAPIPESVVIVEGSQVRAVGSRATVPIPAGADKVDAGGLFVVPGLIDLHVHLGTTAGIKFDPNEYNYDQVAKNLNAYLYFGVTTVRSVGTERDAGFAARRTQRTRSPLVGARLFTAGRGFTARGGHPSQEIGAIARQVSDPADARRQVAELARQEVDLIKIWVDDRLGQSPKISAEVRTAIIEEAKRLNIPVVAHIRTLADTEQLLKAGASGFLHMIRDTEDIPPRLLDECKARQIVFAPTLVRQELAWLFKDNPELTADPDLARTLDPGVVYAVRDAAKVREVAPLARPEFERALRNTRRFAQAGIPIGVGSDGGSSGDFPGAMTHREIELLVRAGLSPAEAIVAATRNGALALGKLTELGTIEPGRKADLLLLRANPLDDVRHLRQIERIMQDGRWIDRVRLAWR
jgi:imidazolonepropionase-like amidohydrolase